MNTAHCRIFAFFITLAVSCAQAAGPLDPYLLHPADRPSECREAPGFYPVNPKVALFYDYKTYSVALPPVADRHAQSLECGQQKGTLYFFAYSDTDQSETAERFARTVLTRLTPAPAIETFPNGFVIVSFPDPPQALRDALNRKLHPDNRSETSVSSSSPSAIAPLPGDHPDDMKVSSETVAISTPVAAPPSVVVSTPITTAPAALEPDLSDEMLDPLQNQLACKSKDLDSDTSEICGLIQAFKTGKPIESVIAANSARVGVGFHIDDSGVIQRRFYDVGVGTGRAGEIAIYPLIAESGVEDIEAQALIDHRRAGKELPAENELTSRIAKMVRPTRVVVFPTQGRSKILRLAGGRRIFMRRSGKQWIVISMNRTTADPTDSSDLVIAGLY